MNLDDLNAFAASDVVTPETLLGRNVIKKQLSGVKVLGNGQLDKALTVKAHKFSKSAEEAIKKAGGTVEVI